MCLCRIVELNTLNGVKNACMSFPIQNAWKEGKPLAVHGVVYQPADGKLKVQHRPGLLPAFACLPFAEQSILMSQGTNQHPQRQERLP